MAAQHASGDGPYGRHPPRPRPVGGHAWPPRRQPRRRAGDFSDDPLVFRPGSEYRYSTYHWILVSAVIEAAAGEPFLMFMNREVLARSGMERTVRDEDGGVRDRVSFYFPRAAQRTDLGLQDAPLADYSCFAGTGAFLSTPSDLARFGSAMLKPGLPKAETVALLQAPQRLESGASTGYALGWNVETVKNRRRANTDGGSQGQFDGWDRVVHDVSGSRSGDCRDIQRVVRQRRGPVWLEGRGGLCEAGRARNVGPALQARPSPGRPEGRPYFSGSSRVLEQTTAASLRDRCGSLFAPERTPLRALRTRARQPPGQTSTGRSR